MGDLVKMTDHPSARWAVVDDSRKLFLSRGMTRYEAETFFALSVVDTFSNAWLCQECDIDFEEYQDFEHTRRGTL